ncbi:MAG: hypothetical protein N2690_01035 [Rhodocyclaceae bacterium]|nr:hypothetical protein [Rhodocyclaceae bacterium]
MQVLVLSAIENGRQSLAAGVIAELPETDARNLIEAGLACEINPADSAAHHDDAPVRKVRNKGQS